MAKLTRCRIAGFSYDNGKSGYSDVIFDYTEENGRTPVDDIVYTIKNGIGKTVLLQAMLQPLKPNTTIAGRHFKEFFPKAKDKAFIALEYRKDNSNEFLTIGIAVRARSRSKAGSDDEQADDGIEYYSFITEYKDKDAPESISWLPFSRTEGNKVYISAYDCIEDMARKGGKIQIIKNDLDRLKSTLRDYGISPDEVDLMGKINQDEGGVQDYFDSKAKTSAQLIRYLMIPSIETAMKKGLSAQESSRDPICESFFEIAKSQSKRMEDAEKRAAVERFMGPFAVFRGKVEILVNAGERRAEASADYMSLAKQLGDYEMHFGEEIDGCKDELKNTEKEQDRLAHEEASYNYYMADDAYREADGEYKEAEGERSDLDQKRRQYSHEKDVLICAGKYASLCEAESERDAVLEIIKEKEKDTDSYEQLDRISYSIYAKASALKEEVDGKLPAERDRRDREKEALKIASDEYAEKAIKLEDNKSEKDRKTGEYETHCKLSDSHARKIPGDICRRLDGRYSKTEIQKAGAAADDKKIEIDKRINAFEEELLAKQKRQAAIPYEKEREYKKKNEFETKIADIDAEIEQYSEIKDVASAVADEYGYSLTRAAEAGVTDAVNLDIYKYEARKDALVGENTLLKIEAAAVEKGSLHVSESALRFLDNEDVEYEIAEALILDMAASGRLETAEAEAMLEANPLLAYAVIVPSERDRDRILAGSNGWVSSAVPIFTREELAAAFEGNQICVSNMLARYDKGYFLDPAAFANTLEEKMQRKASEIEETNTRIDDRMTALDSLFAFYDYSDNWLAEKINEKSEVKNSIEICSKRLNELKQEEDTCNTFIDKSADTIKALEVERDSIEDVIISTKELLKEAGIEDSIQKRIDALSIQCEELESSLDKLATEAAEHETKYENARKSVIELEETADICEEHINTVKWDREHELLEQPVEQLLKWREGILNKQEEDMQQLNNRFEVAKEKVALYENELKHIAVNVTKEEYAAADTSEERWSQLTELMAETAEALIKAEEVRDIAMQKRSDAGAVLNMATDALTEWNKTPLSKSSIGTDFAKRKRAIKKKYKSIESALRTAEKNKSKANNLIYRIKGDIADKDVDMSSAYMLGDFSDAESAFNTLSRRYKEALAAYTEALRDASKCIRDLRTEHSNVATIADYISQCEMSMPDTTSGLDEISGFGNAIRTAEERLMEWHSYLENSLKDIEEEKERFIRECAKLARKYREGIDIIGKKTKVQLDENHAVRMLRIHLPDVGSEEEGRMRIAAELNKSIEECASELAGLNDLSELTSVSRKRYEQAVSGFNLVTTYLGVGPEGIRIDAYKIAEDSSGGEYYRWEQKTRFSGGQRFALYLAVILALLNYARRSYSLDDFDDKLSFSLLLDNPFGTMSSAHLIKPVFSMARKLNAQLICLTDIRNAGVLNQFDVRYDLRREDKAAKKALIEAKRYAGANLFTDIDTEIEEAHFKAEQLSLI